MKYLFIGIILSITGVLLSMGFFGLDKTYLITGVTGLFFIGISILMSGAIIGPQRMRANLAATESDEDRQKRNRTTLRSSLIGLPNIITAIFFYYFIH